MNVLERRTYFDRLEDALDHIGAHQASRADQLCLLAQVDFDCVFVPACRSYVSVAKNGRTVAHAGKTSVTYLDGRGRVEASEGAGLVRIARLPVVSPLWGKPCPMCLAARALDGSCSCS